jgi:hypothetical protein
MFLFALLALPIAYVSHKVVEMFYPGKTKQIAIRSGWEIIQFCSYIEIKVVAAYSKIKPYFPTFNKKQKATITFICSEQEMTYDIDSFFRERERNMLADIEYDFILYEMPVAEGTDDKYASCVLRFQHHDQIEKIEYASCSNFKLNVIRFNFKESPDKVININFQDKQFIINGNILFDRNFLKWHMYKHHSISIHDDDCYTITFIDHKMNYVSFNEEQHILVMKHNYDIISKTI